MSDDTLLKKPQFAAENLWKAGRTKHDEKYDAMLKLGYADIETLHEKGKVYGDSWRKRGGTDSFFMLARKWDRIENHVKAHNSNILQTILSQHHEGQIGDGSCIEDLRDLRRYLLLVDEYCTSLIERGKQTGIDVGEADARYTGQD